MPIAASIVDTHKVRAQTELEVRLLGVEAVRLKRFQEEEEKRKARRHLRWAMGKGKRKKARSKETNNDLTRFGQKARLYFSQIFVCGVPASAPFW